MSKITLTIKGNAATAEHETAKRNLSFTFENLDERWTTVVGTIPYTEANWWTVAKWFNEDATQRAPYPDGRLLYYATRDEAIEVVAQSRHLGANKMYIIASNTESDLFWSNEIGWVDVNSATQFSSDDRFNLNLPIGGDWVELDDLT